MLQVSDARWPLIVVVIKNFLKNGATILSIIALSIMTFSITTLSIMQNIVMLSVSYAEF
jgi:hypothetical protein